MTFDHGYVTWRQLQLLRDRYDDTRRSGYCILSVVKPVIRARGFELALEEIIRHLHLNRVSRRHEDGAVRAAVAPHQTQRRSQLEAPAL